MFLSFRRFFENHKVMGYVLSFLAPVLTLIYIFTFLTSLLNVFGNIEKSTRVFESERNLGIVKEADKVDMVDGVITSVGVYSTKNVILDLNEGDTVCTVQILKPDWFFVMRSDNLYGFEDSISTLDLSVFDDNALVLSLDNKDYSIEYGTTFDVIYNGKDSYSYCFNDFELEFSSFPLLSNILVSDENFKVNLEISYFVQEDNIDFVYCNDLPADTVYFVESTQSYITSIPSSFCSSFLAHTNLFGVLIPVAVMCLLFLVLKPYMKGTYLGTMTHIFINLACFVMLLSCLVIANILL